MKVHTAKAPSPNAVEGAQRRILRSWSVNELPYAAAATVRRVLQDCVPHQLDGNGGVVFLPPRAPETALKKDVLQLMSRLSKEYREKFLKLLRRMAESDTIARFALQALPTPEELHEKDERAGPDLPPGMRKPDDLFDTLQRNLNRAGRDNQWPEILRRAMRPIVDYYRTLTLQEGIFFNEAPDAYPEPLLEQCNQIGKELAAMFEKISPGDAQAFPRAWRGWFEGFSSEGGNHLSQMFLGKYRHTALPATYRKRDTAPTTAAAPHPRMMIPLDTTYLFGIPPKDPLEHRLSDTANAIDATFANPHSACSALELLCHEQAADPCAEMLEWQELEFYCRNGEPQALAFARSLQNACTAASAELFAIIERTILAHQGTTGNWSDARGELTESGRCEVRGWARRLTMLLHTTAYSSRRCTSPEARAKNTILSRHADMAWFSALEGAWLRILCERCPLLTEWEEDPAARGAARRRKETLAGDISREIASLTTHVATVPTSLPFAARVRAHASRLLPRLQQSVEHLSRLAPLAEREEAPPARASVNLEPPAHRPWTQVLIQRYPDENGSGATMTGARFTPGSTADVCASFSGEGTEKIVVCGIPDPAQPGTFRAGLGEENFIPLDAVMGKDSRYAQAATLVLQQGINALHREWKELQPLANDYESLCRQSLASRSLLTVQRNGWCSRLFLLPHSAQSEPSPPCQTVEERHPGILTACAGSVFRIDPQTVIFRSEETGNAPDAPTPDTAEGRTRMLREIARCLRTRRWQWAPEDAWNVLSHAGIVPLKNHTRSEHILVCRSDDPKKRAPWNNHPAKDVPVIHILDAIERIGDVEKLWKWLQEHSNKL